LASSGLAVSFSVLSGPATVSGNILTITGAGTVLVAANQPGNADYSAAPQVTATIVVNKATPTLTWSTPAPITYGTPLSAAQLDATSGGVAGTFAYSPTFGAVLGAGIHVLSVTFTPTDSVDYNNQTASVNLTVNQATAGVNVSCSPNPITYGSQTTNCTTTVGGSATGSVVWTINGGAWTTTGLSGGVTSAGGFAGWSAGSYTIGVTYGGDTNYAPGSLDNADNPEGQPPTQLDNASQHQLRNTPKRDPARSHERRSGRNVCFQPSRGYRAAGRISQSVGHIYANRFDGL
jgi:hypothetical protein